MSPSSTHSLAHRGTFCAVMTLMLTQVPLVASAQGAPQQREDRREQQQQQAPSQQQNRPQQQQQQPQQSGGGRESAQGRPQQQQQHDDRYTFSDNDRQRLQTHYRRSLGKVDQNRRPQFESGREIPQRYRPYITRAPAALRERLPPPPSGYDIGYYQGYTVVYDPKTFIILSVIDLLLSH